MRIGLFSDTYLPTTNGISYVLQIMQSRLEEMGHEVYIFAPATNLRGVEAGDNDHVFRFPAIEGVFFDEQLTSVFFPPSALRKIRRLNLDVFHFFTPGQIGLLGAYAAIRQNKPLISQYSTDIYRYIEEYPKLVIPAGIALGVALPFIFRLTPRQTLELLKAFRPKSHTTQWQRDAVAHLHVVLHNHCDAVIALSRKMQTQLDGWGSKTPTTLLPTGVDPIPSAGKRTIVDFKRKHAITDEDTVFLYVGRLSREKNLDLLIDAFALLAAKNRNLKLMFVGDFDYRQQLEQRAAKAGIGQRTIFTGRINRSELGVAYGSADVFLFPSTTDTQGLVVHEPAGAGLPLILADPDVSEVFADGQTGLLAPPDDPAAYAAAMQKLAEDTALRAQLGSAAKKRAAQFSELGQMQKLEKLYQTCIDEHQTISFAGSDW